MRTCLHKTPHSSYEDRFNIKRSMNNAGQFGGIILQGDREDRRCR